MNWYLKNFYDLYSLDNATCYQAILQKKDWIFRKLYIPVTFKKVVEDGKDLYPELYALMDSSFIFKKLSYRKETFLDNSYDTCLNLISKFNEQFAFLYLYEELDFNLDEDVFFVEINPNKMDEKTYKELVTNFYPCFCSPNDLELRYQNELLELLKLPMVNDKGFVLILAKENLLNDRYYLPIIEKIHYSKKMSKDKIEALHEISNSLQVELIRND